MQTSSLQYALAQSLTTLQPIPSAHGEHDPPQSTPVSLPSWIPSVQLAATQLPAPSQITPLLSVQGVPLTVSVGTHSLLVHATAAHVVPLVQSLVVRHATQWPLPSQSVPESEQRAPLAASAVPQHPPAQVATVHSSVGAGQLEASLHADVAHAPPVPPLEVVLLAELIDDPPAVPPELVLEFVPLELVLEAVPA